MNDKHLHVVSFDVPSPPNYGGVIDVYYKIKALYELGIKVHLHCFEYGRSIKKELAEFCFTVKSYPRKKGIQYFLNPLPYIVITRRNDDLINNLAKDNFPILFEGLHCCFYLGDFRLASRKRFVRMHNIESEYYDALASVEKNFLKKLYFKNEARKLLAFEKTLKNATGVIAISEKDKRVLEGYSTNVSTISAFHQFKEVEISDEVNDYALYHGNLSVGENNEAALFLVKKVFNGLPYKLIIAGSNPSKELIKAASKCSNIEIRQNIPHKQINELIKKAKVNVLPTFQATGVKLKLLHVLYAGKHCIVNRKMVEGTGLDELCIIADGENDWRAKIDLVFKQNFDKQQIIVRERVLNINFNNYQNAKGIVDFIWSK